MIDLEQYAGNAEYPVIDAGDYEFVIKATIRPTKDGTSNYLNVDFKVRDDIEQNFKGAHVFEKLFLDQNNPEWYDLRKSGRILVTQKEKPGYQTKFETKEEFVQYINGICLVATVEKSYDDYSQKEQNSIKFLSYRASSLPAYVDPKLTAGSTVVKSDKPTGTNLNKLNIPDSDIPF